MHDNLVVSDVLVYVNSVTLLTLFMLYGQLEEANPPLQYIYHATRTLTQDGRIQLGITPDGL